MHSFAVRRIRKCSMLKSWALCVEVEVLFMVKFLHRKGLVIYLICQIWLFYLAYWKNNINDLLEIKFAVKPSMING